MILRRIRRAFGRRGYTLLESTVALTLLSGLGYSLVLAVDAGNRSQRTIAHLTSAQHALREVTSTLIEELGASTAARITVTTLADENNELSFQMPIEVEGVPAWGVHDRTLGPDAASQDRADWRIQYSVLTTQVAGLNTRRLVRRILDDQGVVQREDVLLEGLRDGDDDPPGFHVAPAGAVWEIQLATAAGAQGKPGVREVFHVRARN